jgi:hypothetical protein
MPNISDKIIELSKKAHLIRLGGTFVDSNGDRHIITGIYDNDIFRTNHKHLGYIPIMNLKYVQVVTDKGSFDLEQILFYII